MMVTMTTTMDLDIAVSEMQSGVVDTTTMEASDRGATIDDDIIDIEKRTKQPEIDNRSYTPSVSRKID